MFDKHYYHRPLGCGAPPEQNTYYILDGQLWDGVIYRDQSLGHVLHKTMPVFFSLSEVWVVHLDNVSVLQYSRPVKLSRQSNPLSIPQQHMHIWL